MDRRDRHRWRRRRPAATGVAVLAATALVAGCGYAPTWSDGGAEGQAAGAPTVRPEPTTSPSSETPTATPTSTPTLTTATPTATPTATTTPTPSPTVTATATPTPSPTGTPKPRTSLRYGDRGETVLALQKRLTALGYWLGTPDGSFGSLTQQAVFALQKAAGLSRDGVVGPRTKKALDAGVRPKARIRNGVEIDLDRQLLLVVRGGKVRTVLNTSTGNGEEYTSTRGTRAIATTPRGDFTVYRAVDGEVTNSLGELWRPRFFNRGIAVHGSPNIPPYPASHGCARLSNAAINMLWAQDLMPIGSRVLVR